MSDFIKLDQISVYGQIPVEPRHMPIIAITMPLWLFEFLYVPFGLRNMTKSFQSFIDYILYGLHFVCVYVNDVLIATSSLDEHIKHVQLVFERFEKFGVIIKSVKCEFGKSEINFLRHNLNSARISPFPSKVEAFENFPVPDTMREVR